MNDPNETSKSNSTASTENNSGQGRGIEIPGGVKGWSWGAFLLNWIWAIGNRTWIGLLALVPYVGLIMIFVLGFKGRQWAWENKKWESVDRFQKVQEKWSFWGVLIFVLLPIFGILATVIIPLLFGQA